MLSWALVFLVVALIADGEPIEQVSEGQEIALLANQTSFYGESGGQVGDTGTITTSGGAVIDVTDTQKKLAALHVHMGTVKSGTVTVGDEATFAVDEKRRASIRGHHSATHLLHAALRQILGDHVTQKGSMVASDRLRFDVSHPKAVSGEEIQTVERIVNAQIRANESVATKLMDPESAIEAGAMALFGEKYGDIVRVVIFNEEYSIELCGGTHVEETKQIEAFKIISESSIAAGVRRIEAVTAEKALSTIDNQKILMEKLLI